SISLIRIRIQDSVIWLCASWRLCVFASLREMTSAQQFHAKARSRKEKPQSKAVLKGSRVSDFKLDRQGFGTSFLEPAHLLVNKIQLQPVRSAALRRPVFNLDTHGFAGRYWMGQQRLAMKLS